MNVVITTAEARRLSKATGRPHAAVAVAPRHPLDKFAGKPCPFLGANGACTAYADRPLAYRKHASFFRDASACHPSAMYQVHVPMISFSGLDKALFVASGNDGSLRADIRDFFPSQR